MSDNLAIITAVKPKNLSKSFWLDEQGNLCRDAGGCLIDGTIETVEVKTLHDLAAVIDSLSPSQALTYGVPLKGTTRITAKEAYGFCGCPDGAVPHTKDMFSWPDAPGILMLDCDPPAGGAKLSQEQLVAVICDAVPALRTAPMVCIPSASSCIWRGDEELRGVFGQKSISSSRMQRIFHAPDAR